MQNQGKHTKGDPKIVHGPWQWPSNRGHTRKPSLSLQVGLGNVSSFRW